jgi:hypothetical protein
VPVTCAPPALGTELQDRLSAAIDDPVRAGGNAVCDEAVNCTTIKLYFYAILEAVLWYGLLSRFKERADHLD